MNRAVVYAFLLGLLVNSCAKRGAPGGGPKDETTPFVAIWAPVQGRADVDPETWVELTWNEPVDRGSVEERLHISPDTMLVQRSWKGQTLRLRPEDGWMEDQTHWVCIGHGVLDRHDLSMEEPFVLWFSTGDSMPPTSVEGETVLAGGGSPAQAALITASNDRNALRWLVTSSRTGSFLLQGLDPGTWHITALLDTDGDGAYARGAEPWAELLLELVPDSLCSEKLVLAIEDTIPPLVVDVRALHSTLIRVAFTEPVCGIADTTLSLTDSTGIPYEIASAYSPDAHPELINIYVSRAMKDDEMRLSVSAVQDTVGLVSADTLLSFLGTSLADTVAPSVEHLWYADSTFSRISIVFSEAVVPTEAQEALRIADLDSLDRIAGMVSWPDPSVLVWTSIDSLRQSNRYLLSLSNSIHDLSGNMLRNAFHARTPPSSDFLIPPWEPRPRLRGQGPGL